MLFSRLTDLKWVQILDNFLNAMLCTCRLTGWWDSWRQPVSLLRWLSTRNLTQKKNTRGIPVSHPTHFLSTFTYPLPCSPPPHSPVQNEHVRDVPIVITFKQVLTSLTVISLFSCHVIIDKMAPSPSHDAREAGYLSGQCVLRCSFLLQGFVGKTNKNNLTQTCFYLFLQLFV